MRILSVDGILGQEILARDIIIGKDILLISAGTMMRKDYITQLKELGIKSIYVQDDIYKGISPEHKMEYQVIEQYQRNVDDTMMRFAAHSNITTEHDLESITAIMREVMENKDVLYTISYMREKSIPLYEHSLCVCTLSLFLAIRMNVSIDKRKDLAIGALLHDSGLALPTYDQLETNQVPGENDLDEPKKHVIYGYSSIEKLDDITNASKDIVIQHHERADGSGYPFRLKGQRIRMESRIVAICDVFDSMIHGWHTDKVKVSEAKEYITSRAGQKYDREVVKAFCSSISTYPTGSIVMTNENETGVVIGQNDRVPQSPRIRITKGADGAVCEPEREIDLLKNPETNIVDMVLL